MTPLQIHHRPCGTDHPYLAGTDERLPRDPQHGDMVSVGFLTTPGMAVREVRLEWTRNGRAQAPIRGRALLRGQDADRWLVELGVLDGGDLIEYWMVAEGDGEEVLYPRTSFGVRRVHRVARAALLAAAGPQARVATWSEDGQPGPTLHLESLPVENGLRLIVEKAGDGEPSTAGPIEWTAGEITLHVASNGRLTLRVGEMQAPLLLRWVEEHDGGLVALMVSGELGDNEAIVGMGERFDGLDQRGRAPGVTVFEQYKNQGDRTYLPVPFFISSRGYAVLVEGTMPVTTDFGHTVPDRWVCTADADGQGRVVIDFLAGDPAANVRALMQLTGKPSAPPPAWAFGPWMSANEWNTQARVEHEVAQSARHEIPVTALVIEAWSDETTFYIWNGARYTPQPGNWVPRLTDFSFPADGPWPDPMAMIESLRAAGIHLVLWQIPALKHIDEAHAQHDADRTHALERGYVLGTETGEPYRNPAFWFHDALIPDFTSAAAAEWWMQKRAYLLDEMGVDGFKTDGGEHLQGRGITASDGRRGLELVNAYPTLYIGAYHRFARAHRGDEAITFSRAGHTGVGAFPAHWAGDENSTWEAFRRSLVAGLSAGLSGIPFWGWDLAGFSEAPPAPELYLRAAAMAAFCPIMQYHSDYRAPGSPSMDRTPWHIAQRSGDDRVIPLYRHFARVRMNLIPYLRREAVHSAETGEPMLRALLLDAPDDAHAWAIADEYRLGRDLLVAPVMDEGATARRLYLPAGDWYDFWSGATVSGGGWVEVDAPLERIPVFVRAGTLLPLHLNAAGDLGGDVGNALEAAELTVILYPDVEPVTGDVVLGGITCTLSAAPSGDAWTVTVPPLPIPCTLRLPTGPTVSVPPSPTAQTVMLRAQRAES